MQTYPCDGILAAENILGAKYDLWELTNARNILNKPEVPFDYGRITGKDKTFEGTTHW